MPNTLKTDCWRNPGEPYGAVFNRNGRCRLRLGDVAISLDLEFTEVNRKKALRILKQHQDRRRDERVAARLGLALPAPPQVRQQITVFNLITEFERVHYAAFTPSNIQNYESAFAWAFERDLVLDYETVYQSLVGRITEHAIAHSTLERYFKRIKKLMRFACGRTYIDRNPCDTIQDAGLLKRNPRDVRRPVILTYTPEEVDLLVEHLLQHAESADYGWLVRFLSQAAPRIEEALFITWDQITDDTITVIGKGHLQTLKVIDAEGGDRDNLPCRTIAINLLPGLAETIAHLRAIELPTSIRHHRRGGPNYVFRWKEPSRIRKYMREAKAALGMNDDRMLHELRKSALNWWEKSLFLPETVIDDMGGNTDRVRDQHYRTAPTAADLEARVAHERESYGRRTVDQRRVQNH
jgi:integrase